MIIAVGSDHRGYLMKTKLIELLSSTGHQVLDEGPYNDQSVDYPDYASRVSQKVSKKEVDRGILICGTGIGMAIVANKFPGVRAAACYDESTAEMSRRHNDANVLCLSGDMLGEKSLCRLVDLWLATPFEGGRHARRVEKIEQVEKDRPCS